MELHWLGKGEVLWTSLSLCFCIHHIFHMYWLGIEFKYCSFYLPARIVWSFWRLTMGWTVRVWNACGCKISCAVQTSPEAHPSSTMDTGYLLGVKWPEHGTDHPFLLMPDFEWVGCILPSPLCACIGLSLGDLHLSLNLAIYICFFFFFFFFNQFGLFGRLAFLSVIYRAKSLSSWIVKC